MNVESRKTWGNSQPSTLHSQLSPHDVWRDYAGVWHMNEDAGTAFDSTVHGLDGIPSSGANGDISQMVAYENGACGRARVNSNTNDTDGNYMLIPSYDALGLGDTFTATIWVRMNSESNYFPKVFFRYWGPKEGNKGWGAEFCYSCGNMNVVGADDFAHTRIYLRNVPIVSPKERWSQFCFVYSGTNAALYQDGCVVTNGVILPVIDNGKPLGIGGMGGKEASALSGQYDEIRLRGGTLSADRIKADYDMIANRAFLAYGKAKGNEE